TDRRQVVPVLCCLLSPAYFLGASGSFFSAASGAFGCSALAFALGRLKNDLIFCSAVIIHLLYLHPPLYSKIQKAPATATE
ncbi:MAG: hypothetical protein Q8O47_08110, partial [Candidatus Bathyarchaeota archaeon]|nr:hypothetical protein [Candidatus Bathyarchaeota archaeon]